MELIKRGRGMIWERQGLLKEGAGVTRAKLVTLGGECSSRLSSQPPPPTAAVRRGGPRHLGPLPTAALTRGGGAKQAGGGRAQLRLTRILKATRPANLSRSSSARMLAARMWHSTLWSTLAVRFRNCTATTGCV